MSWRRQIAGVGLAVGLAVGQHALAQRPIVPICSDNAADKLPPCKAPAGSESQPAPASGSQSTPATGNPFPGGVAAPASQPLTNQFPFPGSEPAAASPADPSKPGASQPAPAVKQAPTAGAFPFPGEDVPAPVLDPHEKVYDPKTGDDVPVKPQPNAKPGPDDSSSSSSSSSSPASGDAPDADASPLKDLGSEGSTRTERRRLPKVEDMGAREEEDIKVSKFYHSTGNYMAAYLRAKDAMKIDPDDAEAHLLMAINAQKLAKKDEAIAGYTTYLKLSPDGDDAKVAQRGLETLK